MRIASTAAPSAPFLSPRPTQREAASAADSVTRTSSSARLRSGFCELAIIEAHRTGWRRVRPQNEAAPGRLPTSVMGQIVADLSLPAQPRTAVQMAKAIVPIADQLLDEEVAHWVHESAPS